LYNFYRHISYRIFKLSISGSVIFVDIDAHNRNRQIFETLLPRESSSKNIDISLLSTISYPAFATHDGNKLNRLNK
jgi:phosphorylase kinase alpha/beta subunit